MESPSSAAPARPSRFTTHFVESVLLTWLGNLARIVIGLVALRLVTGAIPEDALGAYWILSSVAAILSNFADLGLGLGVVRHLPLVPDRDAARRLMQTVSILRLGVVAVLCALVWLGKPLVLRIFDAAAIETAYPFLYAFIALSNLNEMANNFLQGQNRFRAIATMALVTSALRFVLIIVFVRTLNLGVPGLFYAEALSMAIGLVVTTALAAPGWQWRLDPGVAVRQVRFGFPLYLNSLLSFTANRINTVLIGSMSTTAAVSYFTVAGRVPDQLSFILKAYVFVYLPSMTRLLGGATGEVRSAAGAKVAGASAAGATAADLTHGTQAGRLLSASLRLMSFCFAMLALVLSLYRHELLLFLAPEPYQAAAPAVPLLLGGLVFAALGLIMGNTFVALGDSRTPVKINLWTSLLSFGLNWICIARWGFLGAAWASFVFNLIGYALTDAVLSRRIRPAGRGYLGIVAFLGALVVAGLDAPPLLRPVLVLAGGLGSIVLSPALRGDLWRVWRSRAGRGGSPAEASGERLL